MGFSAIPARPDTSILIPTLELWTQRADDGLVQLSIPWTVLLADTAAAYEVRLARLPLPVIILEGGWPSISVGPVTSTPAEQARYLRRQAALLDQVRAEALFQVTVDSVLGPKPALDTWDSIFRRTLVP